MKGFMFFFMMFGLFAALGRDESAVVPKHDVEVVVEQPVVSTEPVIEEPVIQEPAVTEPVSYENAAYALTVKETDYLYEGADVPLYVKDGMLYSLSDEWNDGGYNSILTGKDLKTGNTVSKAVLEKHDVEDALCELGRPRGKFELIFPLKENIEKYKKYFKIKLPENELLWKKLLNE